MLPLHMREKFYHEARDTGLRPALAILLIAALFHDLGKAFKLFQKKIRTALRSKKKLGEPIRHELISLAIWHALVEGLDDEALIKKLSNLSVKDIDLVVKKAKRLLEDIYADPNRTILPPNKGRSRIADSVGLLILTHHRLPNAQDNLEGLNAVQHVNKNLELNNADLSLAAGSPIWGEHWWLEAIRRHASELDTKATYGQIDMALRSCLMLADHMASAKKEQSGNNKGHLANTIDRAPADTLNTHTQRTYQEAFGSFDLLFAQRDNFPALSAKQMPQQVTNLTGTHPMFQWKKRAAGVAKQICSKFEAGFFACVVAPVGTGKTGGGVAILSSATFNDKNTARRKFRISTVLNLRALTTQTAAAYTQDLGFDPKDISVLIGQKPLEFHERDKEEPDKQGEPLMVGSDWLQVADGTGELISDGSNPSHNPLPDYCEQILAHASSSEKYSALLTAPVLIATIDHLIGVASPVRAGHLPSALRVLTSDLIIDEIDQFNAEDKAVLPRLAYQVGASGRRLVIMSATERGDLAGPMFDAYRKGWKDYAKTFGVADGVNLLVAGDRPETVLAQANADKFEPLFDECRIRMITSLNHQPVLRKCELLPACANWHELVDQIDQTCSRYHDVYAVEIEGVRVSVGLANFSSIAHTAAMAAQLKAGVLVERKRLRLKACLHSQFMWSDRNWIEYKLKRALTRKGPNPSEGLTQVLSEFGAFQKASDAGVKDIEIVVVSSPVIETGNDLDFDYAIIDPVSLRALIHVAGRVNRHRFLVADHPNIAVLGCSPIVLEKGALKYPGMETPPEPGSLLPPAVNFDHLPDRLTHTLLGEMELKALTTSILFEDTNAVPFRDLEREQLRQVIDPYGSDVIPILRKYCDNNVSRMNRRISELRKFRRSVQEIFYFTLFGENLKDASWHINFAPDAGGAYEAAGKRLEVYTLPEEEWLFSNITARAMSERSGPQSALTIEAMKHLLTASVQYPKKGNFRVLDTSKIQLSCSENLGLTKGCKKDLFLPFGKGE